MQNKIIQHHQRQAINKPSGVQNNNSHPINFIGSTDLSNQQAQPIDQGPIASATQQSNNGINYQQSGSERKRKQTTGVKPDRSLRKQPRRRMQQQSQGSIGMITPQSQKMQNIQLNKNNKILQNKNDSFTQKLMQEQTTPSLKVNQQQKQNGSRTGKRESHSDNRLITKIQDQQQLQYNQSQNSQGSSSTAITGSSNNPTLQNSTNNSGSGSDQQFKSKQLLEQKQIKLRQILSNSPQTRLGSMNQINSNKNQNQLQNFSQNDIARNNMIQSDQLISRQSNAKYESAQASQQNNTSMGGDETPKSNRSRKNKRIIIDTASNNSRGEIIIKETVQQQIEVPNTASATNVSRKIPIDVQKKKKIIKVDQIQRLFKSNIPTSTVSSDQEHSIPKQHVDIKKISRVKGEILLPNLNLKVSPRQYETQHVAMDPIDEESIQNQDVNVKDKTTSNKSRFLQKVSSNQSAGDSHQISNAKMNELTNNIAETVSQLKLKRESKTLPQLHLPLSIGSDELSPKNNIFSQTNPNNMQQQFHTANEEISFLKQELNLKNSQLSQLLNQLRNKPNGALIASKESSQLIKIRKNPHHQSVLQQNHIQLKNKNRRGSDGQSDSPQQIVIVDENQKTAVPALIKVKKDSKHKSHIEQMKRAISQPELPPSKVGDSERDEMQKSIREIKKHQNGQNQHSDKRGGGTAHLNQKNFQSNKEIFEYSPMVQNNYIDSSPDKEQEEQPYGKVQLKINKTNSLGKKTTNKAEGIESDDLQAKVRGQKRNNESAKNAQQQKSEELIQKVPLKHNLGSSKLLKKPIKLPILNTASRVNNEEFKESQEENKSMPSVQTNTYLKQNLIEKYQQYNQIYQKQIQTQIAQKQEGFKENKQSFSMKNLHYPNPILGLDQESNNTETNFNTNQKSQSKDSLVYGKMKSINSNGVNLAPIKLPTNSSTKSNFSKNMSVGTLVLKKDQIRLNKGNFDKTSSNNTNTFRNFGSIQASEIKPDILESQEINKLNQNLFINESIKPSTNDLRGSESVRESNWNIIDQYKSQDEQNNLQINYQLLEEDNPFLEKQQPYSNQNSQQQNQVLQAQFNQLPIMQLNPQLMMMYPPPPFPLQNFPNYSPALQQQMMIEQQQQFHQMMLMNAAMYHQQFGALQNPNQSPFSQPSMQIPLPPQIMAQKYPQSYQLQQNPATSNKDLQDFSSPQNNINIIPPFDYSDIQQSARDMPPQNSKIDVNQSEVQPLYQHEMMIMNQDQLNQQSFNMQPPLLPLSQEGPIEINRKMLIQQQEDGPDQNVAQYTNINPFDKDDELCNYEASDTPRDFFGKLLRESVPIMIIDDKEDDGIRSSTYSIKSRGPKDF
eukprot:403373814